MLRLITAFFFFLLFGLWHWGFPVAASLAAKLTPAPLASALDERTVQSLDGHFLEPSQIPADRQAQIVQSFNRLVAIAKMGDVNARLLFRSASHAPTGAFALPGGTIILTDSLIDASRSDSEVLGVLAHELALVANGAALRKFFASLAWPAFSFIFTRDTTTVLDAAEIEGGLSLHMAYPAHIRGAADLRAVEWLLDVGENPTALADLYERLGGGHEHAKFAHSSNLADERSAAIRSYLARRAPR